MTGTTIRITAEVKRRLDLFHKKLEKESGAPLTYSLVLSHLLKREGQ